jgi:predicted RNA polymerase sigma factor
MKSAARGGSKGKEFTDAWGIWALMELQASRTRARVDVSGEPILLLEQNRAH